MYLWGVDMAMLGSSQKRRSDAANQNYRKAEIKRLLIEGVKLSKIAKMLEIDYELAKRLSTM